jgi:hypothetical protein
VCVCVGACAYVCVCQEDNLKNHTLNNVNSLTLFKVY